jgi:hypothetical protein
MVKRHACHREACSNASHFFVCELVRASHQYITIRQGVFGKGSDFMA